MAQDKIFESVLNGLRELEPDERKKAFGIIKR